MEARGFIHVSFTENYDLGFVTLPERYDENALEDALERRMTRFLLELGEGWAFVGRQKEIVIAGKTRKIDLLFYHIYLRCYAVIELKVKPFEPEFAGKLNFYINAVDELIRRKKRQPDNRAADLQGYGPHRSTAGFLGHHDSDGRCHI